MQTRKLGRTGLDVSVLTFGCGAVGGLMTKGDPADQDRAVAWALDNGINHLDTAPLYGQGASETNLGRALDQALGRNRGGVVVSTKVRLGQDRSEAFIRASLEESLTRLRQDHVDVLQLHNTLHPDAGDVIAIDEVFESVIPAFEKLREEGKTRFLGFTANGETKVLHRLVASGQLDTAQVFYNVLTPSAGEAVPHGYPGQDYRCLLGAAKRGGVGTIGVRVLAGGALSGNTARHPLGMPSVDPIGSGRDYATDAARARAFQPLIDAGHVNSLPELALRYAISNRDLSTTEIGVATLDELQQAANAVNAGPLSELALVEVDRIREGFAADGG